MRFALLIAVLLTACKKTEEPAPRPPVGSGSAAPTAIGSGSAPPTTPTSPTDPSRPTGKYAAIGRGDFNRYAVRLNLPVYWIADANNDKAIDPGEVSQLLFYPTEGNWTTDAGFTPEFDTAYAAIVAASRQAEPQDKRQALVAKDLDQGRATLILNDLAALSATDKAFVLHMLTVAKQIDELYAIQNGSAALASKVPAEPASQSLFRRNRGPKCAAPATEGEPECSAIPGAPRPSVDVYPPELAADKKPGTPAKVVRQSDPAFCGLLEQRTPPRALEPFTVVRSVTPLVTQPYTVAYKQLTEAISRTLTLAADKMVDPTEQALVTYLRAAAASFKSNDWKPADEAWAKMSVDNSKWYVRVGPDEVYWEPCAHKAGFHLTFARINQASKEWQGKLAPLLQNMEDTVAKLAGPPYAARKVAFHLPDFIDVVLNAGDDRDALGITAGQSLPNWGPVANEGRGRTIAMVNVNIDPDSVAARRGQAESLLDTESMTHYAGTPAPGLVGVILHEAMHNLGPAHEYAVAGKKAPDVFGGPIASVLEELKAQTGALFLFDYLRGKQVITDELAGQAYVDQIVWAFGQMSQGMYADGGKTRKAYPNLAAIQIGFLIDKGALTWDAKATAANGTDTGVFTVHTDKLAPVAHEMLVLVAGIKSRGDVKKAQELIARYVDSEAVVPHKVIAERFRRFPKQSYVYAIQL